MNTIDITSAPALRLALACALWADLCRLNQRDAADAIRAEVVGLKAGVDMAAALADLRESPDLRLQSALGIAARGLPIVDAHAFGEGWEALGTVALTFPSLLALHARAIALRGTGRVAWGRVDAYRAEHSASGYGWGNAGGETERAEDDALCAAFNAAEKVEHESIADLCAAIRTAGHGAQPDGSFVARSPACRGSVQTHHTLHAPAKQGPLCEVRDHERGTGSSLVALRTREEARVIRAAERVDNAARAAVYEANRQEAGAILRRGGMLPYCAGREYGFVTLANGCTVSARGALVAAGLTREAAIALLETCESAGMLSLGGVST